MSWATRRKLIYLGILLLILVVVAGTPLFLVVYKAPSCSDGKQNQGERGIDCGGPCKNLCQAQALEPVILWQRAFKVSPGSYNLIAYVKNLNVSSGSLNVPYSFKLYDRDNILIVERTGFTDLLPNKSFPIFESAVPSGEKVPSRVSFEFNKKPFWIRSGIPEIDLRVSDQLFSREDSSPRLEATIENQSIKTLSRLPVVAILYDLDGNAISASRTIIDLLEPRGSARIIFTWPEPFGVDISQKEITPIIYQAEVR